MGLSGPFADAAETLELDDAPGGDASPDGGTPPPPETDPAPETPAPTKEPDPATAPADDAGASDFGEGWKLDAKGRLHRPDGTNASKAEVEAWKAAHPETPVADVPDPAKGPDAPPPAAPTPYVFAGHDKPLIEGALVHPETGDVFVPAAQRDWLERMVVRGTRYEQYRDERRDAIQRAEVADQRSQATVGALVDALPFLHTRDAFMQYVTEAARSPEAMELAFDRLNLAIDRSMDAVSRKFGPMADAKAAPAAGNDTPAAGKPLDRDEATEAFADYFREQLARPEFKGMPAELRETVRQMLMNANLFVRDADGDWCLNEKAAAPAWAMAQQAMQAATKAVHARTFNAGQAAQGKATTAAPPSVAAGKPRAGAPAPSGASRAERDPLVNPATGKRFDDPWDAVLRA